MNDIFKINQNPTVYYFKKAGILLGLLNCVVGQEDHILTQEELDADPVKKELYEDTLLFVGKSPLMAGYPIEDPDRPGYVRLANRYELVNMGKDKLQDGEKIDHVDKVILTVPKPNEFAKWDSTLLVWNTDFDKLPDGWKIVDRDTQKIRYIESPNYAAKWDKVTEEWKTDVNDLRDGEKLLISGKIEIVEQPLDDNQHTWAWNKQTFLWENVITQEQLRKNYFKIVERHKADCIDAGFMFKGYQQKCRVLDMNWITQRMNQTRDDALAKDQINFKYELINGTTKDKLMKVGWVFNHNEVLMLDILDFKEMFDNGASFTQSCYIAEETLKDGALNFELTLNDFRAEAAKYTKTPIYMGPALSEGDRLETDNDPLNPVPSPLVKGAMFFRMPEEPDYNAEGVRNNPAHKLGLRGSEVILAAHYGLTLEEAAERKAQATAIPEKQ